MVRERHTGRQEDRETERQIQTKNNKQSERESVSSEKREHFVADEVKRFERKRLKFPPKSSFFAKLSIFKWNQSCQEIGIYSFLNRTIKNKAGLTITIPVI